MKNDWDYKPRKAEQKKCAIPNCTEKFFGTGKYCIEHRYDRIRQSKDGARFKAI